MLRIQKVLCLWLCNRCCCGSQKTICGTWLWALFPPLLAYQNGIKGRGQHQFWRRRMGNRCLAPPCKAPWESIRGSQFCRGCQPFPWNCLVCIMKQSYALLLTTSGAHTSKKLESLESGLFFHFPPKFRLWTWKPSRLHCTNASPSACLLCCPIAAHELLPNLYSNLSIFCLVHFANIGWNVIICALLLWMVFFAIYAFLSQFTHFFR